MLGLRWRLFDFGRIDAQIDLAKGQEAEQLAAYRLAVLRATEDVENAFSALVKREQQANVLEQGVDSLSRARQASFEAYQQGVVSLIEVLQADDNLLRAADARAQAQPSRPALALRHSKRWAVAGRCPRRLRPSDCNAVSGSCFVLIFSN